MFIYIKGFPLAIVTSFELKFCQELLQSFCKVPLVHSVNTNLILILGVLFVVEVKLVK